MIFQIFLVVFTFSAGSLGGMVFSRHYFASSDAVTLAKFADKGAHRLFCVIFGVCCNTMVLILFEVLGVLSYNVRLAALKTHIILLVLFMLCAVPSYQAYGIFRVLLSRTGAIVATCVSQLLLVYGVLCMLPAWPGVPEPQSPGIFSFRVAVLRMGVLGVCAIGILAGFGTVAFPYTVIRAFIVPVNPYEVKALQSQLGLIREQIADKQDRAALLEEQANRQAGAGPSSWMGSALTSFTRRSQASDSARSLRQSVEALQTMEQTLQADVLELVSEQQRARAASTVVGRLLDVSGYILAAYCVCKMALCAKAVFFGEDFSSDPASRLLSLLLLASSHGSLHVNAQALGQYVTLVFVGFISFNSLRAFLSVLRQVSGQVSRMLLGFAGSLPTGGATGTAERMVLGLGALLCAYTVSSVMLMRAQLPVQHRVIVTAALGFDNTKADLELDGVHRWFNGTQLSSLIISFWLCYWKFKNKKANAMELSSSTFGAV